MITNAQLLEILGADDLSDWRKLGQALHARYRVGDLSAGARLAAAVAGTASDVGDHARVTIDGGHVDVRLVSRDAVYRDAEGNERVVAWVTQRDVDLARAISAAAAELGAVAEPGSITTHELALDTAHAGPVGAVWAALFTGSTDPEARGRGSDVRDTTGQMPILWFQDTDEHETPRQRFHIDIWVAPEVADARIAAAVAAGGVVVDDSQAPSYTVIADPDGNKACVCTFLEPAS